MFKICIIGCGWVANFGHGPAYRKYAAENSDVELTACCDIDENKASAFKEKYGFKRYDTDYLRMLKNETPNVVCLNVPDSLIAPFAKEILKAGYPLLLEKPPGISTNETLDLIEVVEKTGTPHTVAFNRRFMPMIQTYKKTIKETVGLNNIQNIQYDLFRYNRTESNFDITAIHGIDTVRYITDSDYKTVYFFYQEFPEYGDNVMNIYMHADMKSGAKAILNFCPVSGAVVERATVNCLDYLFFIDVPVWDSIDIPGKIMCVEKNEIIKEINFNDNRKDVEDFQRYGFYNEDKTFFDSVRSGTKLLPDVKSCLQTIEISDCICKKQKEYRASS